MHHKDSITIIHKGKEIIYIDYRNLKDADEYEKKVEVTIERTKFYKENNINNLLVLTDLTGSIISGDVPKYLKKSTRIGRPYVKKSAVIGIVGAKKVFLNIVNVFSGYQTKAFLTIEDAKEWLVS